MLRNLVFIAILFSGIGGVLYAQESLNVQKTEQYLKEVYRDCPQYAQADYIEFNSLFLKRILVHKAALNEHPECPLLSTVALKNKCNADITYDAENFSVESFNPFKYHFPQQDHESRFYRVDRMNFIIEIKPKNERITE